MTSDEYLDWEANSPIRHEYRCGQVWAMSGATLGHGLVAGALSALMWNHLRGGRCRVVQSDLKVEVDLGADRAFYYPDIVVLCDPPKDPKTLTVSNPTILVEVFSPSTEDIDRKRKWRDYATLSTLREYVLVNPEHPSILVRRRRGPGDEWRTEAFGPEDSLLLPSIDFSIELKELYVGIEETST